MKPQLPVCLLGLVLVLTLSVIPETEASRSKSAKSIASSKPLKKTDLPHYNNNNIKKSNGISFQLVPQKTRKLTSVMGHKVPLVGNLTYWGEYFAKVGLGTPPQYVNLQVDTG